MPQKPNDQALSFCHQQFCSPISAGLSYFPNAGVGGVDCDRRDVIKKHNGILGDGIAELNFYICPLFRDGMSVRWFHCAAFS